MFLNCPIFPHPHSPILLCLWGWTKQLFEIQLGFHHQMAEKVEVEHINITLQATW